MTIVKSLFSEKFRPKSLDDLIAVPRIKKELEKGLIQNLLLFSSPGTGKSSCAFLLSGKYDNSHTHLYINASAEGRIDMIRDKIIEFCSGISLFDNKENTKCIILDECLDENEKVRIGTLDNYKSIKLKDLELNKIYPMPSLNIDKQILENDTGEIVSIKEDDIYEIELENGKKIKVNSGHPMMILNNNKIEEKSLDDGLNSMDDVIFFT